MSEWSFLTNHGAVLMLIAQHGQITAKEIADTLGITERPVRRIIAELEADGYLKKHRVGRVNWYHVQHDLPLRQPIVRDLAVRDLLQILTPISPKKGEE
jgi:DNA-binding Lrp family transcriptional regulator